MSAYTVSYKLESNDAAWILDGNSVKKGICLQTIINVVPATPTSTVTNITYIILLDCNAGTMTVNDSNVYLSLDAAIQALQSTMSAATC